MSTALALALLCALLALRWPKAVTVAATAALGAAAVLVGADYFAEALALVLFVCDRLRRAPAPALCWPGWALLGAWPLLSFLAALLQWRITARGCAHSAAPCSSQQQQLRRQKETKSRMGPTPTEGPPRPMRSPQ